MYLNKVEITKEKENHYEKIFMFITISYPSY